MRDNIKAECLRGLEYMNGYFFGSDLPNGCQPDLFEYKGTHS